MVAASSRIWFRPDRKRFKCRRLRSRVRNEQAIMRLRNSLNIGSLALLASCTLFGTSSRVKQGELVETGDARYDAYFKDVHDMQVNSVGWSDERQAACRPLVDELRLPPDAAGVSIVQETNERVKKISHDVGS